MSYETASQQRRVPTTIKALAGVGIIVGMLLLLRYRWLDLPCLNPDEDQYMAFASYLNRSDLSAFDRPILHVYTHWLYQQSARWFGEYDLGPMRRLVFVICGAVAVSMFLLARRDLGVFAATLGSLIFIYQSAYFEGLSANREWLSLVPLIVGWWLYVHATNAARHRRVQLFVCGFVTGIAVWFKEQAAPMTLVLVLDIAYRATLARSARQFIEELASYALGGALSGFVFAVPMLVDGTFEQQWEWLMRVQVPFASRGNDQATENIVAFLFRHFYLDVPFRRLFLLAACGWLLASARIIQQVAQGRLGGSGRGVPTSVRISVWYAPAALFAIQLGHRMYPHYYLFLLPASSVLVAYAFHECWCTRSENVGKLALWTVAGILWIADAVFLPSQVARQTLASSGSFGSGVEALAIVWMGAVGVAGIVAMIGQSRRSLWSRLISMFVVAACLLETGKLIVETHLFPEAAFGRGSSLIRIDSLNEYLRTHSDSVDRLFVWGWRPEIYTGSRIGAATSFATCLDILNDPNHSLMTGPDYNQRYADELIEELKTSTPRYIVDAWLRSLFGSAYRIDYFPPLHDYLQAHYQRLATIDGCDVYERSERKVGAPAPDNDSGGTERAKVLLDEILRLSPEDPMVRLTKADVLAQAGEYDAAREIYSQISLAYPQWDLPRKRIGEIRELHADHGIRRPSHYKSQ